MVFTYEVNKKLVMKRCQLDIFQKLTPPMEERGAAFAVRRIYPTHALIVTVFNSNHNFRDQKRSNFLPPHPSHSEFFTALNRISVCAKRAM